MANAPRPSEEPTSALAPHLTGAARPLEGASAEAPLGAATRALLAELDSIGAARPELTDTDVRERLSEAIGAALVRGGTGRPALPPDLGMFTGRANAQVRAALSRFLRDPRVRQAGARQGGSGLLASLEDSAAASAAGHGWAYYFGMRLGA